MRGARRGPALLFVAARCVGPREAKTLAQDWSAYASDRGGRRWTPGRLDAGSSALSISSWESGELARAAWTEFVAAPGWLARAGSLEGQPLVHLLRADARPWPGIEGPLVCFELTADATVQTREDRASGARPKARLLPREELPSLEGGELFATIGHPGRFVGVTSEASYTQEAQRLEATLGPWVEGPRCFRGRVEPAG